MNTFVIVHLDLSNGRRSEFPERFQTRAEAAAKLAELSLVHPQHVYVMQLIPAA